MTISTRLIPDPDYIEGESLPGRISRYHSILLANMGDETHERASIEAQGIIARAIAEALERVYQVDGTLTFAEAVAGAHNENSALSKALMKTPFNLAAAFINVLSFCVDAPTLPPLVEMMFRVMEEKRQGMQAGMLISMAAQGIEPHPGLTPYDDIRRGAIENAAKADNPVDRYASLATGELAVAIEHAYLGYEPHVQDPMVAVLHLVLALMTALVSVCASHSDQPDVPAVVEYLKRHIPLCLDQVAEAAAERDAAEAPAGQA